MPHPPENPWFYAAAYTGLAAIGGFLGYLMRTIDTEEQITFGRVLLETMAAGFVGLLVLFVCQSLGVTPAMTGVIVGMSGWLGATASIQLIKLIVYDRLNIKGIISRLKNNSNSR